MSFRPPSPCYLLMNLVIPRMYILLDLVFNIISFIRPSPKYLPNQLDDSKYVQFVGFALVGKDIVLRFSIEYSSLRDFDPQAVGLFWYEVFWKMIFWLVLKLEISYNRVIISWRILISFRGFFERLYFFIVKYLSFHNFSFAWRHFSM